MFIMWPCILFKNLKTFDTFIKSWWFSSNQEYPKISNFLNFKEVIFVYHHSIGDVHQFIVHCSIPSGSLFKKSFLLRSNVFTHIQCSFLLFKRKGNTTTFRVPKVINWYTSPMMLHKIAPFCRKQLVVETFRHST